MMSRSEARDGRLEFFPQDFSRFPDLRPLLHPGPSLLFRLPDTEVYAWTEFFRGLSPLKSGKAGKGRSTLSGLDSCRD